MYTAAFRQISSYC